MRIVVAGLGFMGAVHLRAIEALPITLAAVVSRGAPKFDRGNFGAEPWQFDLSNVRHYRDLSEASRDPEIDAIDLCLPTHLHESAAIEALENGKHVLVEKPMALDVAACHRMIDAARRCGRVLMVAQVLRFFPAYRALAGALPSLGRIRSATLRRRCAMPTWGDWQRDPEKSGGAVLDLLIHDIDMALRLFGEPSAVEATGKLHDDIDLISSRLSYDAGFAVEIVGGWHPGKFPLSMKYRVTGEEATIEYDFNRSPPRRHTAAGAEDLPLDTAAGFSTEIAYFADCVRRAAAPLQCPPEDSARAVALARVMIESRRLNGEKIPWTSE